MTKRYTKEVKEKAIKLVREGDASIAEVAKKLKVSIASVRKWVNAALSKNKTTIESKANMAVTDKNESITKKEALDKNYLLPNVLAQQQEIQRLKQENAALKNLLKVYFEEN